MREQAGGRLGYLGARSEFGCGGGFGRKGWLKETGQEERVRGKGRRAEATNKKRRLIFLSRRSISQLTMLSRLALGKKMAVSN